MSLYLYANDGITFPPCPANKKDTFNLQDRFYKLAQPNDDSPLANVM